jgi:hypothetical protein
MGLETFNIIHEYPENHIVLVEDLHVVRKYSYIFRYTNTTDVPRSRTTRYGNNSFRYEVANS